MLQSRSNADSDDVSFLKCYNLPFGVIGFVSHIFTYWTIVWLWHGRRPLWPYHEVVLKTPDLVANTLGFIICVILSAMTLNSCKNHWELMAIAIWKLSTSLLNALMGVYIAWLNVTNVGIWKSDPVFKRKRQRSTWLLVLCKLISISPFNPFIPFFYTDFPGLITGMSGLYKLLSKFGHSPHITWLTVGFFGLLGVLSGVATATMIINKSSVGKGAATGVGVFIILFLALSVFYCDLCLGFMFDDVLDTPSESAEKTVFYWLYFAGERLPLFTW